MREDLLQFIWEAQLFDQVGMRTECGKEVEIIHPGRIQPDSGPDAQNARIRLDGQQWAGHVELHVRSGEWFQHAHDHDEAYDNVILHVVHSYDVDAKNTKGTIIPTLAIGDRISTDSLKLYGELMKARTWVPCEKLIDQRDPTRTELWLERLLVERLERKTAEIEKTYRDLNGDEAETFYHALAKGFGTKVNADAFATLARILPLSSLLKYRDDRLKSEAMLFGQAGLMRVDFVDEHPRKLQAEYSALAQLHGLKPMSTATWKFARMRPNNFPTIRLALLAALFDQLDGDFAQLLSIDDPKYLRKVLNVQAGDYWTDHFRPDESSTAQPKRLGDTAADHLIINTLVPFLFAMGRLKEDQGMTDRALKLLEKLPAEKNNITRGWAVLGLEASTAGRSQALLELKNEYCNARKCLTCSIGNQLLRRTCP